MVLSPHCDAQAILNQSRDWLILAGSLELSKPAEISQFWNSSESIAPEFDIHHRQSKVSNKKCMFCADPHKKSTCLQRKIVNAAEVALCINRISWNKIFCLIFFKKRASLYRSFAIIYFQGFSGYHLTLPCRYGYDVREEYWYLDSRPLEKKN